MGNANSTNDITVRSMGVRMWGEYRGECSSNLEMCIYGVVACDSIFTNEVEKLEGHKIFQSDKVISEKFPDFTCKDGTAYMEISDYEQCKNTTDALEHDTRNVYKKNMLGSRRFFKKKLKCGGKVHGYMKLCGGNQCDASYETRKMRHRDLRGDHLVTLCASGKYVDGWDEYILAEADDVGAEIKWISAEEEDDDDEGYWMSNVVGGKRIEANKEQRQLLKSPYSDMDPVEEKQMKEEEIKEKMTKLENREDMHAVWVNKPTSGECEIGEKVFLILDEYENIQNQFN